MNRLKEFLKLTMMGGLMVVLPVLILLALLNWMIKLLYNWVRPLTETFLNFVTLDESLATGLIILFIISVCFLLGLTVNSRLGKGVHGFLEKKILEKFPGYSVIRDTLEQFLGKKNSAFSKVALVDVFNCGTRMTAFITDEHANGYFTVFVPTGPNPTSGNIYHLPANQVTLLNVPIEETMRTVISCGAGSTNVVKKGIADKNQDKP
jgi:uncharacterized membrane protein